MNSSRPSVAGEVVERRRAVALAVFMLVAGLAHFGVPRTYERIVPRLVGDPSFWVRWSGIAEIACAGLLVDRRTRRVGGVATAVLLVAVFPGNVKMALDGGIPGRPFPLGSPVAAWLRLPLQVPMVVWAWRVARSALAENSVSPRCSRRSGVSAVSARTSDRTSADPPPTMPDLRSQQGP